MIGLVKGFEGWEWGAWRQDCGGVESESKAHSRHSATFGVSRFSLSLSLSLFCNNLIQTGMLEPFLFQQRMFRFVST